ncbi:hypothetical protein KSP39_PZI001729 [Platanthera zijinensis]|uniref:Uncharacterized protein n=1 Tax=Platanthera zijinensis TaxID=2320716 RepID=A0AAP0BYX0_9ASPA
MLLHTKLAGLECENALLKDQLRLAEAVVAVIPPPTSLDERLRSRHYSEYDIDKLLQVNAQATARLMIETLRDVGCLNEGGETIVARRLLPWHFELVPKPPGAPDSPPSDVPKSPVAAGGTSDESSDESSIMNCLLLQDSSDGLEELSWFADFSFSPEGGEAGSLAGAAQVPEMLRMTNEEQNFYRPPKSSMPYKKPRLEMLEEDDFFTVPDVG